jgi:hypothetical protein
MEIKGRNDGQDINIPDPTIQSYWEIIPENIVEFLKNKKNHNEIL